MVANRIPELFAKEIPLKSQMFTSVLTLYHDTLVVVWLPWFHCLWTDLMENWLLFLSHNNDI